MVLQLMRRPAAALFAAVALVSLVGCSGEEPAPVETRESREAARQASEAWTPEKLDAMKGALSQRRDDTGNGVKAPGMERDK